jgi:hypothetical protein
MTILTILLIGSLVLPLAVPALQSPGDRAEYDIKAAFVFNFARFTEWPVEAFSGPNAPLVLGIYGVDPFSRAAVDDIASRPISGRRVEVRKLDDLKAVEGCHILFINGVDDKALAALIGAVKNKHVLTVGQGDRFGAVGGMIRFFIEDTKVRFEVNLREVQRADLKISAKLLSLAKVVR